MADTAHIISQIKQWVNSCLEQLRDQFTDIDDILPPNLEGQFQRPLKSLLQNWANLHSQNALSSVSSLRQEVEQLQQLSLKNIQSKRETNELSILLRLFQLSCIFWSELDLASGPPPGTQDPEAFWRTSIARLDRATIVTGGDPNSEIIEETIQRIQSSYLPVPTPSFWSPTRPTSNLDAIVGPSAARSIPSIPPPSMKEFRTGQKESPFILRGYASDWPALTDRPWSSIPYLRYVVGPGRIVPVEVGREYTQDEWGQELMEWDQFLDRIQRPEDDTIYLAQHSLFKQFPALRADIDIPSYVYSVPSATDAYPGYHGPRNDEELVLNVWLGPKGTVSPAHTDPYYNCYVQVAGRKSIWLAPPSSTPSMYSHDGSMSNTSRVDVFASDPSAWPLFLQNVVPSAQHAILEPGDLLFFPPGWWHAMRSEDISFSVSMWF